MSHDQLDQMLEIMQYFVALVNTLSHCAILLQYFVTQPTRRVIQNKELVRIAGSQVCELWESANPAIFRKCAVCI